MMKRCPTCNRNYTDQNLSFCIEDGTPLVPVDEAPSSSGIAQTETDDKGSWSGPAYTPPSYIPKTERRRVWPWVLGIFAFLFIGLLGLGIAGAVFLPRWIEQAGSNSNANANTQTDKTSQNTNVSSATPEVPSEDSKSVDESSAPPSDEAQVLAQLTEIEHEWTVANINADKKALDRILADDYVGRVETGRPEGKAEYIRNIKRDTMIQSWEFHDLKVNLKGDRATLDGVIMLRIQNQELFYRFTDKFVWREGRWQATSSEVAQIDRV